MRKLWRDHLWALGVVAFAVAVTLFFLLHITLRAAFWLDPAHHDMTPQPRMTAGLIGKSWKPDAAEINAKAEFPSPGEGKGHPLTPIAIARTGGVPVSEVITDVEAVVLTAKARGPQG